MPLSHHYRPIIVILALAFSGTLSANASPVAQLKLVGEADLSILFWDIYEAKLYSKNGQYSGTEFPIALEIKYLRDITRLELLKATKKELLEQPRPLSDEQIERGLASFSSYWPDIQSGQVLTFILTEDRGRFFFNQRFIGEVESFPIAKAFIDIWLAEDSSYPKLSARLRGEKDG